MNAPRVIGADPGITGAIALLSASGELLEVVDMPTFEVKRAKATRNFIDVHTLGKLIAGWQKLGPVRMVIERVNGMPTFGASTNFSLGFSAGALNGVAGALSISIEQITPPSWKKHFNLPRDKEASRQLATNKWPTSTAFQRKKDENRAEAALIGLCSLEQGWARGKTQKESA